MPKKSSAPLVGLTSKKQKKVLVYLLTIGVPLLVLGIIFYRNYSVAVDKRRFEQARESIDKLYAEIEASVGKPNISEKKENCSRPSLKFEKGPLSCDVSVDFSFSTRNINDANNLMISIVSIINASNYIKIDSSSSLVTLLFSNRLDQGANERRSQNFQEKKSSMNCSITYRYLIPSEEIQNTNMATLSISLGCHAKSRAKHYPMS